MREAAVAFRRPSVLPRHDSVFKVISLLAVRFIPILFCVAVSRLVPNWSHFLESFV